MMIGHLTIAGLAEFFVASGLTAFIQRTDPTLLGNTATTEPQQTSTRRLWMILGMLLMLTPLGILAAGTAWGEWGASDFADPEARKQIAASSLNAPLPHILHKASRNSPPSGQRPYPTTLPACSKANHSGT